MPVLERTDPAHRFFAILMFCQRCQHPFSTSAVSMSPSFKHLVNCSRDSAYSTAAVRSSWDPTQTPAASLRALSPRHATQEEVFTSSTPPKVKHELCILQFLLECHEEENDDVALLSVRSPALPASIICRRWHFFRRRGMTSSHMRNHGQSRSDQ